MTHELAPPSPNFPFTPTGGRLNLDLTYVGTLCRTSLQFVILTMATVALPNDAAKTSQDKFFRVVTVFL
ncbi:hypothetical protein TNCV_164041 [Trichonephila clavipes]|nr:hypothetical protein TNCV_164041 [Trichonephila clavipes]